MNIHPRLFSRTCGYVLIAQVLPACSNQDPEDVKPDPAGWSCPEGTSGSPMVLIQRQDARAYCIDARLTTYAEYQAFLDAKAGDTSGQPSRCAPLNDSFLPPLSEDDDIRCADWKIGTHPERPVNCVDFCDAWGCRSITSGESQ